jgi:hypothetical protein
MKQGAGEMLQRAFRGFVGAVLVTSMSACAPICAQTARNQPNAFPLWKFDEIHDTCRAKGRLQDKEYCDSKLMDRIIAAGKDSIPILISQLTDERRTDEPIYDYWTYTTAGDIASFILDDLFTDSDWKTYNMPGMASRHCHRLDTGEMCWRNFLKKHGRKFVQNQWLAAWNANKDRVYWDERARCFRLSPKIEARKPGRPLSPFRHLQLVSFFHQPHR